MYTKIHWVGTWVFLGFFEKHREQKKEKKMSLWSKFGLGLQFLGENIPEYISLCLMFEMMYVWKKAEDTGTHAEDRKTNRFIKISPVVSSQNSWAKVVVRTMEEKPRWILSPVKFLNTLRFNTRLLLPGVSVCPDTQL